MSVFKAIRKQVSGKRNRYQKDGFDLDLTYITPQLIAMGLPSEGLESAYRNPIDEVAQFFDSKYPGHYLILNLSQLDYNTDKFHGRVLDLGFPDHHPPPLPKLFKICEAMKQYLDRDQRNVIGVHCKAGKGRTGVAITCYFQYVGTYGTAIDAMNEFAMKRANDLRGGVAVPSQRRYVMYFEKILKREVYPVYTPIKIVSISMNTVPNADKEGGFCPVFTVLCNDRLVYHSLFSSPRHGSLIGDGSHQPITADTIHIPNYYKHYDSLVKMRCSCIVSGDVLITFYHLTQPSHSQLVRYVQSLTENGAAPHPPNPSLVKLWRLSFNTAMHEPDTLLSLFAEDLDGPKHVTFSGSQMNRPKGSVRKNEEVFRLDLMFGGTNAREREQIHIERIPWDNLLPPIPNSFRAAPPGSSLMCPSLPQPVSSIVHTLSPFQYSFVHPSLVLSMSRAGRWIALGGPGGSLLIFDVKTGRTVRNTSRQKEEHDMQDSVNNYCLVNLNNVGGITSMTWKTKKVNRGELGYEEREGGEAWHRQMQLKEDRAKRTPSPARARSDSHPSPPVASPPDLLSVTLDQSSPLTYLSFPVIDEVPTTLFVGTQCGRVEIFVTELLCEDRDDSASQHGFPSTSLIVRRYTSVQICSPTMAVSSLFTLRSMSQLMIGCEDGQVILWDSSTARLVQFHSHTGQVAKIQAVESMHITPSKEDINDWRLSTSTRNLQWNVQSSLKPALESSRLAMSSSEETSETNDHPLLFNQLHSSQPVDNHVSPIASPSPPSSQASQGPFSSSMLSTSPSQPHSIRTPPLPPPVFGYVQRDGIYVENKQKPSENKLVNDVASLGSTWDSVDADFSVDGESTTDDSSSDEDHIRRYAKRTKLNRNKSSDSLSEEEEEEESEWETDEEEDSDMTHLLSTIKHISSEKKEKEAQVRQKKAKERQAKDLEHFVRSQVKKMQKGTRPPKTLDTPFKAFRGEEGRQFVVGFEAYQEKGKQVKIEGREKDPINTPNSIITEATRTTSTDHFSSSPSSFSSTLSHSSQHITTSINETIMSPVFTAHSSTPTPPLPVLSTVGASVYQNAGGRELDRRDTSSVTVQVSSPLSSLSMGLGMEDYLPDDDEEAPILQPSRQESPDATLSGTLLSCSFDGRVQGWQLDEITPAEMEMNERHTVTDSGASFGVESTFTKEIRNMPRLTTLSVSPAITWEKRETQEPQPSKDLSTEEKPQPLIDGQQPLNTEVAPENSLADQEEQQKDTNEVSQTNAEESTTSEQKPPHSDKPSTQHLIALGSFEGSVRLMSNDTHLLLNAQVHTKPVHSLLWFQKTTAEERHSETSQVENQKTQTQDKDEPMFLLSCSSDINGNPMVLWSIKPFKSTQPDTKPAFVSSSLPSLDATPLNFFQFSSTAAISWDSLLFFVEQNGKVTVVEMGEYVQRVEEELKREKTMEQEWSKQDKQKEIKNLDKAKKTKTSFSKGIPSFSHAPSRTSPQSSPIKSISAASPIHILPPPSRATPESSQTTPVPPFAQPSPSPVPPSVSEQASNILLARAEPITSSEPPEEKMNESKWKGSVTSPPESEAIRDGNTVNATISVSEGLDKDLSQSLFDAKQTEYT
ncbi:putative Phosphatidylinositol 3,4,5-trisphosphate 3-phosphatase [Blattamonas nauphoetae]|uniref:Phosphatidylinositol 3,4,5-trisphosphate 3-phosphatase n=1 Tax=Blattamonas nauphoetae TaxID=2049346 RepID=A0ABQ9YF25_9EUKA|nr:putative Phosphatidylinositol 3,4,5-trisphosphate 3-phosphatase [Blattamonas nauphoetae]